jgi:hypothetical protein
MLGSRPPGRLPATTFGPIRRSVLHLRLRANSHVCFLFDYSAGRVIVGLGWGKYLNWLIRASVTAAGWPYPIGRPFIDGEKPV